MGSGVQPEGPNDFVLFMHLESHSECITIRIHGTKKREKFIQPGRKPGRKPGRQPGCGVFQPGHFDAVRRGVFAVA